MNLLRSPLVRSLEPHFRSPLDELARARGWPTTEEPGRLGELVRRLSDSYNRSEAPRTDAALAARLLFSFPRDVPKGAGAVRELVASGALSFAGPALRVLDLGAGLGATSRGVARALSLAGGSGDLEIDAIDSDAAALALATRVAELLPKEGGVRIRVRTSRAEVASSPIAGPYDLILMGQVLSELDRQVTDAARRAELHVELLSRVARALAPRGSLVIIEPALRERARHLHAVRDVLLSGDDGAGLTVFAPCLHDGPCPMRKSEDGWCHEDLDVDLPDWLAPVAKAAGLRYQGLTFSYLVLRRDGRRLIADAAIASSGRVVSAPRISKGKRELFLCGPSRDHVRAVRLDRHRSATNAEWDEAARGDVLTISPPLDPTRPRVIEGTSVERARPSPD